MYAYLQGEIHVHIHGYDKASYKILVPSEGHVHFDLIHVHVALG